MTSRSAIKPDSSTAFRVAAHVIAHPGRELHEIAAAMGWTVRHCSKALTGAKQSGMIDVSRAGRKARWYSAAAIVAVREAERQQVRRREKDYQQIRNGRAAMRKLEREADASGPGLSDVPIRRHASPSAPLPFVCRAAASVFCLGSML